MNEKKPRADKHEWEGDWCKRCGMHCTKVYDLVYECKPVKAKRLGYRKAPSKKKVGE